jgi:hypothetical protein
MNSKLDYLAQKEEELRKLNEQIDSKKANIGVKNNDDLPEAPYDGNEGDQEADAMYQEEEEDDDYAELREEERRARLEELEQEEGKIGMS